MTIQNLFNSPIDYSKSLGDIRTTATCADTATSTGFYLFVGGTNSPTDTNGSYNWVLQVMTDRIDVIQIAERINISTERIIYVRSYHNNTWTGWIKNSVTCDDVLSTTSTNPIQNKPVTEAINTKFNTSGGTFTGKVVANSNTDYTTYQIRNIALSTSASTPANNGDLIGVYS